MLPPMIGWFSLLTRAHAASCPVIADEVALALSSLDQTEFQLAEQHIAAAYQALACQSDVVATAALLELYWVDGLIALAQNDTKGVVYATLRAVAADHAGGRPPDRFGPELQSSFDTWLGRLAQEQVTVTVGDGGTAWVDGRTVDATHPLKVYEGEHLLQVSSVTGQITSWVQELSQDYVLTTGIPRSALEAPLPEPVLPLPEPVLPDPVPRPKPKRKRHPALVVATLATSAVAGVTLMSGFRSEGSFQGSPYLAARYGRCNQGDPCWFDAREQAIRQDAQSTNRLYAVGYGASAIAGGLLVVTIIGFPAE